MAKERSDKKEKKEKKEKRSDSDGIHKSKKDKKDKIVKKSLENGEAANAVVDDTIAASSAPSLSKPNGHIAVKLALPIGALVPFANPLADEKVGKKVFKSVKKGKNPQHVKIVP